MPDEITPEIFRHLADLAALEMDEQEAEYLRAELNRQLKAIHELEAIKFSASTMITSHGVPYTPEISAPLRQDEIIPCEEAKDILAQAPELEEGYIQVPDIPSEELE